MSTATETPARTTWKIDLSHSQVEFAVKHLMITTVRGRFTDFAGTVEAVGRDITGFQAGDEVFGGRTGAFAEYVCARMGVAPKPANLISRA